jgi:hypothetical protein
VVDGTVIKLNVLSNVGRSGCRHNPIRRAASLRPLSLALLLVTAAVSLRAECIKPPGPCRALNSAEVVFYGEVLDVVWHESPLMQDVRFNIVRGFKGVRIKNWFGTFASGSETYNFQAGQRVVVYATFRDGMWTTACNRTRAFASEDKPLLDSELAKLKACAVGATPRYD